MIDLNLLENLEPRMEAALQKDRDEAQKEDISDASSSRQLRIAICVPELQSLKQVLSGGPADATYIIQGYISAILRSRGHKLTFVAPRDLHQMVCTTDIHRPVVAPQTWSGTGWFNLASKGVWSVQRRLGVPYLNVFSNYRRYDACLRCLPGHDVVYERNGLYRVGVAMACKRLKLPYVLFFEADEILEHDFMGTPIAGPLRWQARRMIHYNLHAANCVICVSEAAKTHLITNWDVPAEKVVVFPNGVDVQRFRPDPEARSGVRTSLGVDSNPLIMFVGSFYEWHDVATLLDAFAHVLAEYPGALLVLIGDGSQRPAMEHRAAELGVAHAVKFTGLVAHADVPELMAAADVAVVPYPLMQSDLWLSPLKLFEYMATGAAVIASKAGQLADVVQDGSNGLLVPPGDTSALAAALMRLIADPNLRARLGQQAREDAVRKYSWEHYVSRLEQLYAAVIAGQPVNLI
jgi:glycosyltransferase involved in cell wall biosynthesis